MSQRTWIWISNIHFGYQTLNVVNAPENTVWNLGIFLVTHILRKISSIRELPKIHQNDIKSEISKWEVFGISQTHSVENYSEIKIGAIKVSKYAILSHSEALNLDFYWFFALFEGWNLPNQQIQSP